MYLHRIREQKTQKTKHCTPPSVFRTIIVASGPGPTTGFKSSWRIPQTIRCAHTQTSFGWTLGLSKIPFMFPSLYVFASLSQILCICPFIVLVCYGSRTHSSLSKKLTTMACEKTCSAFSFLRENDKMHSPLGAEGA